MTGDFGNIDVGESFSETDDLINAFMKRKRNAGTSQENYNAIRVMLKENGSETAYKQFLEAHDIDPLDATVDDLYAYKNHLEEKELTDGGIDTYLGRVSVFYRYLRRIGIADSNPAGFVREEVDLDTDSPERVHITVDEMKSFIEFIDDPEYRAIALLLLKTGVRRGESLNIDLRCLHLDDPRYQRDYLDYHDISLHQEIANRPDSLYIYAEINEGDVVAGEERADGNKRERSTIIPIDEELKKALLEWLSIRPRTTAPHPLFTATTVTDGELPRLTGTRLYKKLIRQYASEFGITNEGYDPTDVDVHYFRHFFSTQMRKGRGDHDGGLDQDLVKYIRGDVMDDDILDVYTHDSWGVNVREEYLNNIYTFDLY